MAEGSGVGSDATPGGGSRSGDQPDATAGRGGSGSAESSSSPSSPSSISFGGGRGDYDASVQAPGAFLSDTHPELAAMISDIATKGLMTGITGSAMPGIPGFGIGTLTAGTKALARGINAVTDRMGVERGQASGFPGGTGGGGTAPIDPTTAAVQAALRPQADRRAESFQANLHPHTAAVALAALKPHIAMFQHALKQGRGAG